MDDIRIAVVGLGTRSLKWLSLLERLAGFRVTAICDPYPDNRARFLKAMARPDGVRAYERYDEVLTDANVDAVALVARCREQGEMAAMALEAGKHCHQEVPAAHTLEDCWRIVLAQERSGKVYLSAEQARYSGFVHAWRDMVAAGTLGKITYAEGQYLHYYVDKTFRDPTTGELFGPREAAKRKDLERTWMWHMPPIHYLVHDLSPLLKVLDDRVVEVMGMSNDSPSAAHPELGWPDIQMAVMKTAKGTMIRQLVSFAQPHPEDDAHWWQVIGTGGSVEFRRSSQDQARMWLAGRQMHSKALVNWTYRRTDEPVEARGSGHDNLDYYVHEAFRNAVLHGAALDFDVYKAMDVAACGILAADSIAQDGRKLRTPDFRPHAARPIGQAPPSTL
jgi:predicted dehydrogenase